MGTVCGICTYAATAVLLLQVQKCITSNIPATQILGQIMVVVTIATNLQAAVHAWLQHTNVYVTKLMSKHTTL